LYKKETRGKDQSFNGEFVVIIDDVVAYWNLETNRNDWELARLNLTAGNHKVVFVYEKFSDAEYEDMFAYIDEM
jgi:hypothetical protein